MSSSDSLQRFWRGLAADLSDRRREIFDVAGALAGEALCADPDPVDVALTAALLLRRHPDATRDALRETLWRALLHLEAEARVAGQPPARLGGLYDYDHQLASLGGARSSTREDDPCDD